MVEKSGGRAKSTKMLTVQCTICGMDMDCPESMLSAQRHFCARCTDMLAEGYEPEDLKMDKESMERRFRRCDEVAEELFDLTFHGFRMRMRESDLKNKSKEALAKECFKHGAPSSHSRPAAHARQRHGAAGKIRPLRN